MPPTAFRRFRSAVVALAPLLGAVSAFAADIDFEAFAQDTAISTQYAASHGAVFSLIGNAVDLPIIAENGCPRRAYSAASGCPLHDTPSIDNGGTKSLTDPLVSGTPQDDYGVGQSIAIDFDPPILGISLSIIDIDHEESVTIRALDGATEVAAVVKSAADRDTGNRLPTPVALFAPHITRVEIVVPDSIGYALDDIFISRVDCPGDLNADRSVSIADLAILLAHFAETGTATRAHGDLDADGDVDLSDLAALLANFSNTCE